MKAFILSLKSMILSSKKKNIKEKHQFGLANKEICLDQKVEKKYLYEKWASKEYWYIKDQAIPLLIGVDPDSFSDCKDKEKISRSQIIWQHIQDCVKQNLLIIGNQDCPPNEWKGSPINIYQWAVISRIKLPDSFSSLMEFIIQSLPLKKTDVYDKNREYILGLALAILANFPDKCRDSDGKVVIKKIADLLYTEKWTKKDLSTQSIDNIVDTLNIWLNKIPKEN